MLSIPTLSTSACRRSNVGQVGAEKRLRGDEMAAVADAKIPKRQMLSTLLLSLLLVTCDSPDCHGNDEATTLVVKWAQTRNLVNALWYL